MSEMFCIENEVAFIIGYRERHSKELNYITIYGVKSLGMYFKDVTVFHTQ